MKSLLLSLTCFLWATASFAKPSDFTDTTPPTVVCLNGLSIGIMPIGFVTIWTSDLLAYAEDNETPTPQLVFAMRRSGAGTGFPVDNNGAPIIHLDFGCQDLGTQPVELWAKDLSGNTAYCQIYVLVVDNNNNCNGSSTNPPTVVCNTGLVFNMTETGATAPVLATDLLQSAEDDETAFNDLVFGVRNSGAGVGFPFDDNGNPITSLTFDCDHLGSQLVELWALDENGNADYCETLVNISDDGAFCNSTVDSIPPTITCLNGISINIAADGAAPSIWTSDVMQYAEDNETPNFELVYGLRIVGTGTGFPYDGNGNPIPNLDLNCSDLGTNLAELWVMDQSGNATYCTTTILVQDNFNYCNALVLGTEQIQAPGSLRVSPNPGVSTGQVTFLELAPDTRWTVLISDVHGRRVCEGEGIGQTYTPEAMAPGMYFLRLQCQDGRVYEGKWVIAQQ